MPRPALITQWLAAPAALMGGQAVFGGVLMRSDAAVALAWRRADGRVAVRRQRLPRPPQPGPPLIRSLLALGRALGLGTRALRFSAAELEAHRGGAAPDPHEPLVPPPGGGAGLLVKVMAAVMVWTALGQVVASAVAWPLGLPSGHALVQLAWGAGLLTVLAAYLTALARLPEVAHLFAFHGAEHRAVRCLEAGLPLTVDHAMTMPMAHPRCGSALLLGITVLVTGASLVLAAAAGDRLADGWPGHLLSVPVRATLVPVCAAVALEFQRAAVRRQGRPLVSALLAPGLWFQRLTLRPPDPPTMEVALAALTAVVELHLRPEVDPSEVQVTILAPGTTHG